MSEEKGKEPSREEVVAWYKDQIELSTLRADLAEQQARAVRFESERLQHAVMIANIKTAGDEIMSSEEEESLEESKS
jgi:porphobilinogen deaminase